MHFFNGVDGDEGLMKLELLFFLIFYFLQRGWGEISFHQYFAG